MSIQHIKKHFIILMTAALLSLPSSAYSATPPSLSFSFTQKTTEINETFTVDIIVDTGDKEIAGAGAKIKFTPQLLRVQNIKAGSIFPKDYYPSLAYDNSTGTISISGIAESKTKQFKGKGTLAQIKFQAIHKGTDNVRFLFERGKTTESNLAVTYGNGDILENVSHATIEIVEKKTGPDSSNRSNKSADSQSANGNNESTTETDEEVLGESDNGAGTSGDSSSDGTETALTQNGTQNQPATTDVLTSQKQPVLGAFSHLSLSPKDWNKTTLLTLLFINVAAIGIIATFMIRRHRASL